MARLLRLQILEYALEGVSVQIGTHPCPLDYPEDIDELEEDRTRIIKLIQTARQKRQHACTHSRN